MLCRIVYTATQELLVDVDSLEEAQAKAVQYSTQGVLDGVIPDIVSVTEVKQ